MKKATILLLLLVSASLASSPASAQFIPGGHNETSEDNAVLWSNGAPNPGVAPAAGGSAHLLLSELIVTPTGVELIEIHNATGSPIALDNYYLTDAWFEPVAGPAEGYHLLPTGTFVITTPTDFMVRFPAGSSIDAGETQVIAMYGAGVDSAFGAGTADYEVTSSSGTIPDMINVGGNSVSAGATTLTNGSEFIALFYWDQVSDNVCDVDYVTWGTATTTSRVDKSGVVVDGPDADAIGTPYLADTPDAGQSAITAPGAGDSASRLSKVEGAELSPGNGCVSGGATSTVNSTWGRVKVLYR